MRWAALLASLGLLICGAGHSLGAQTAQKEQAAAAPEASATGVVRTAMRNVEYHLTDRIIVHIVTLDGRLTPKAGGIPVFDDKTSFTLDVDTASITISTVALTNDLNDFVFAKADAPMKKLSASIKGDQLTVKGLLVSKGGIPFETSGTLAVTPEGMIRVHTTKVKALKLPVKGLMDMLGLDTQKVVNTSKVTGVSVDKDDLILDPEHILPPPQLAGHLTSIKIENGLIALKFSPGAEAGKLVALKASCPARNYVLFKGGTVRFGKLTMTDADLELMDADPADPFDFAIDHYQDQLVAGYSKSTADGGLCVHMPDYDKIPRAGAGTGKK
ncbi:MAG: hypothetical protein WBF14_13650 [Candidatus Acidiferrales bacterium]